jgi:hypothetical protein
MTPTPPTRVRAVDAGGRRVRAPRDTPEHVLRIAFVANPDGNLVELLPSDDEAHHGRGLEYQPRCEVLSERTRYSPS